jgi:cytochrome c
MGVGRNLFVVPMVLALAACGGKAPQAPAQATGEPAQPPAAVAARGQLAPNPDLAAAIAAADLVKGKVLFLQCRACHSLVPEAESGKIGPTLYAIVGRPAGTAPGFEYSEALARSGITWTVEEIDKWLQRPSDYLPGNKMVFVGIQNPQDRANIIAFIEQESARQAAQ